LIGQNAGPKTHASKATFDDLLPEGSTFAKKDEGPKSIGDMKKKNMAEEMDPIKLKVCEIISDDSFFCIFTEGNVSIFKFLCPMILSFVFLLRVMFQYSSFYAPFHKIV
jgi:hypothetical protein